MMMMMTRSKGITPQAVLPLALYRRDQAAPGGYQEMINLLVKLRATPLDAANQRAPISSMVSSQLRSSMGEQETQSYES